MNGELGAFFDGVLPILAGQRGTETDGLAFYAELVATDQARILGELYPDARGWVERAGHDWRELVARYVRDVPPRGWSVPHLGERLGDWLFANDSGLPDGLAAVVDLTWARFLARTAPDDRDVDGRIQLRHYGHDPVALIGALRVGAPIPATGPSTWLVYRHLRHGRVETTTPSLATLQVLTGAADLLEEQARLVALGLLRP